MDAEQLQQLLEEATEARTNHEYDQALARYTDILDQTPPPIEDDAIKEIRLTALRRRGRLLRHTGKPQAALETYEQYYLEAGSSERAVEALTLIGRQSSDMGQHVKALEAQREAQQLAEALNYTLGRARALGGLGLVFERMGRAEESVNHLKQAVSLFSQVDDPRHHMSSWNQLGIGHVRLGELDKAIEAFKHSLDLAREVGERETAIVLGNLGETYQNLFAMEQALVYHQEGLAIAERIKLDPTVVDLCRNLGVDLQHLGRIEEGMPYLQRALALSNEVQQHELKLQALYSLALAKLSLGEVAAATEHVQELRALAEAENMRGYLADALHAQGLCHKQMGNASEAEQTWQEAIFLAHETSRRMLLWQLHAALAQITDNASLATVHNRIAKEVIEQIAEPIEDKTLRQTFLGAPPVQAILDANQ